MHNLNTGNIDGHGYADRRAALVFGGKKVENKYPDFSLDISLVMTVLKLIFRVWV